MYIGYAKERENLDCIEKPYGFLLYRIAGEECYISDYWIKPDHRGKKLGYELADICTSIAKERGCKYLTSQVDIRAGEPEQSLGAILKYGFKIINIRDSFIEMAKKIGE